jgi:hypothetical protein
VIARPKGATASVAAAVVVAVEITERLRLRLPEETSRVERLESSIH